MQKILMSLICFVFTFNCFAQDTKVLSDGKAFAESIAPKQRGPLSILAELTRRPGLRAVHPPPFQVLRRMALVHFLLH